MDHDYISNQLNYDYTDDRYVINKPVYSIVVNLEKHTLTLFKDGTIFKNYPVGIGKPSTPTPKGTFRIVNKQYNPGGPYGARWMGLNSPGIGIHGTNNPASIGKSISHGCIRMFNPDVIELNILAPIGTVVTII